MTLYHTDITVPAGTPASAPVEQTVDIEDEVLTKIAVTFPPGCAGEVYAAVFYGPYQLFPRPDGAALHDDGRRIEGRMYWETPEKVTTLTIRAWAPTTQYAHTIMIDIEAVPKRIANPANTFERLTALIRRMLFHV